MAEHLVPLQPIPGLSDMRLPLIPVETSRGKNLLAELQEILGDSGQAHCVLLIGQGGPEKTLVLKELGRAFDSADGTGCWIYFDSRKQFELLLNQDGLITSLLSTVAERTLQYLAQNDVPFQKFVDAVLSEDSLLATSRLTSGSKTKAEKLALLDEVRRSDPVTFLKVCLRYLARQSEPGKVVLVMDNLESFATDVQLNAVDTAQAMAQGLGIFTLVSIRGVTARLLSHRRPELMKSLRQLEVVSPRIKDILKYLLARTPEELGAKGLTEELLNQLQSAWNQLFTEEIEVLLRGLSNGSFQEALLLIRRIFRSPYLSRAIPRVAPDGLSISAGDRGPHYFQMLKALMLDDSGQYHPEASLVGNAFGASSSCAFLRPFLRIYIILLVQGFQDVGLSEADLCETLGKVLEADPHETRGEVAWLLEREWLERAEEGYLAVTARGSFFVNHLIRRPEYQSQVVLGMEIAKETGRPLSKPVKEPIDEARNLCAFLDYLVNCEMTLLRSISRDGLRDFQESFGTRGLAHDMVSRAIEYLSDRREDDPRIKLGLQELRSWLDRLQRESDIPSFILDFGGR